MQYAWREAVCQRLTAAGIAWQKDAPLAPLTTFRIGGPAALLVRPADAAALQTVLRQLAACRADGIAVRHYCLGNGSNTLFSDAGYDGVVIHTMSLCAVRSGKNTLSAEAGAPLAAVCRAAAAAGLSGLEFAYGIPGAVGGAIYMNAGAYGGEMKDVTAEVVALDETGTEVRLSGADCGFGYRTSAFQTNGCAVAAATFTLVPDDPAAITARMEEYAARRKAKQPLAWPSAGSTFKRPQGAFAAALIDECGLKGMRVGGAAVSEKHAGFVINAGGATCADVLALTQQVAAIVREKTGYILEREIRVVE